MEAGGNESDVSHKQDKSNTEIIEKNPKSQYFSLFLHPSIKNTAKLKNIAFNEVLHRKYHLSSK